MGGGDKILMSLFLSPQGHVPCTSGKLQAHTWLTAVSTVITI